MDTPYNKNEFDVQCCQNLRHNLIAKDIILRDIKQHQASIDFTNQLDIPIGLKDLITNYGFTSDLLLNIQPTDLAHIVGIDTDVAKIITDATKRYIHHRS
jgi:hypothetical protein